MLPTKSKLYQTLSSQSSTFGSKPSSLKLWRAFASIASTGSAELSDGSSTEWFLGVGDFKLWKLSRAYLESTLQLSLFPMLTVANSALFRAA